MSHTPGKWEVDDEAIVCANNRVVALTDDLTDWDTRFANARLIAAAPDLLAALIRLRDLDVNCSQQEDRAAWEQAHAAIARAEGK